MARNPGIPVIVKSRGDEQVPDGVSLCYIVAANGIFLFKRVGVVEAIVRVDGIPMLQPQEACADLDVSKIPQELFARIFSFFRAVFDRQKTEAVVILFFNPATREWQASAPQQRGTSGSVHYQDGEQMDGWLRAGTIHSHCDFAAFHSGGDHHDEMNWDGLHITVGNITRAVPTISVSLVINGQRFLKGADEYVAGVIPQDSTATLARRVEGPPKYVQTPKGWRTLPGKTVLVEREVTDKGFTFDFAEETSLDDFPFPAEWMERVVQFRPTPRAIVEAPRPIEATHAPKGLRANRSFLPMWAMDAWDNLVGGARSDDHDVDDPVAGDFPDGTQFGNNGPEGDEQP